MTFLEEVYELVVDVCALGLEEAGAGGHLVEEEELLLDTNLPVVTLSSLFLQTFQY